MFHRLVALLIACSLLVFVPGSAPGLPRRTKVQTYKGGLAFPVDMAWVPGTKKIFFTEKNTGKVRVLLGRRLLKRPCVNLDVNASGERGALGIALHPGFKRNNLLYVYYTNSSPLDNRVTRFRVRNNRCRNPDPVVTGLRTSGGYHNGGQIEFVKGKLFVAVGETHEPSEAQDPSSRLGKILRYNPDGSVPSDNPFGNANPVWSYGHRNPFGLAHKPGTHRIWSSENGPSCDDELNHIVKGRNYGWGPGYDCGTNGVGLNPKGPEVRWSNIIVPTDLWWYRGRMKSLSGSLYMGAYANGSLYRFVTNSGATDVRRQRVIYDGDAPIIDVSKGPRGWLYFATTSAIRRIVPR